MPNVFGNRFHHMHNRCGAYDSICDGCFVTVATEIEESELAPVEDTHVCDPMLVYQISESARHALSALNLDFGKPRYREVWR